jgi:hypothetical protein
MVAYPNVADKTFMVMGKPEQPNAIRWSVGTVWKKVPEVLDMESILEGFWIPEGGPKHIQAKISVQSSSITIDMSECGRPTPHGDIISDSINDALITVIFLDDFGRTLNGIVERDNISWSNGSVWNKFYPEG